MKSINVSLKTNPYKIVIGGGLLKKTGRLIKPLNLGKDAVVITNPVIYKLHGKALMDSLKRSGFSAKVLQVPDGERAKSAKYAMQLMEQIARYDILKKVFVVAFGGGVIGDLAGYVAAAYKRGVPYIQVPTTFLAQIDSSIGGKVAIDLPVGKNLVGAFYQPKMVISDVDVLKTIGKRQVRNGLAEAVKYGIIKDKNLFAYIKQNTGNLLNLNTDALEHVVVKSSRIKTNVVLADEKETKGIRTILNFGHTLGHAIEAAGNYRRYHHGESIALGMRVAARISRDLKLLSASNVEAINELLTKIGLPQKMTKLRLNTILHHMQHDKKFISGKNRFVLARSIGRVTVKEGIPLSVIKRAIKAYR